MADIFISYKKEDKPRVAPLVAALEARGYTVWWDQEIDAGEEWFRRILAEVRKAKLTIGVWSTGSVDNDKLFRPNKEGKRYVEIEHDETPAGRLIPVLLDSGRIPLTYKHVQAVDLVGWKGDAGDARLVKLFEKVVALAGPRVAKAAQPQAPSQATMSLPPLPPIPQLPSWTPPSPPAPAQPEPKTGLPKWLGYAIGAGIALAALGAWQLTSTPSPTRPPLAGEGLGVGADLKAPAAASSKTSETGGLTRSVEPGLNQPELAQLPTPNPFIFVAITGLNSDSYAQSMRVAQSNTSANGLTVKQRLIVQTGPNLFQVGMTYEGPDPSLLIGAARGYTPTGRALVRNAVGSVDQVSRAIDALRSQADSADLPQDGPAIAYELEEQQFLVYLVVSQ